MAITASNGNGHGSGVQSLIDYIQEHGLRVGDRLPSIRDLSEDLQMGRNVVRDAVQAAQTMGLIRVQPRSSTFIQSLDFEPLVNALSNTLGAALASEDQNLIDILESRRVIEVELSGQAAARRRPSDIARLRQLLTSMDAVTDYADFMVPNEKFHLEIAEIAGNQVLHTVLRSLLVLLRPLLVRMLPDHKKVASDRKEHLAIFRSIVNGDVQRARAAMAQHIGETMEKAVHGSEGILPQADGADAGAKNRNPKSEIRNKSKRPKSK